MKLTEHIHLIGSGCMGLSAPGDCNVYAVTSDSGIYIIDCGLSADPVDLLDNLRKDGLSENNICGILLTHAHTDHASAVPYFNRRGIPVIGCQQTKEVLAYGMASCFDMGKLTDTGLRDFLLRLPLGMVNTVFSDGEEIISDGQLRLTAIYTPAHSGDSVCYLAEIDGKRHLFTGDTVFYPGQISCFSSVLSFPENYYSIIAKLLDLRPEGLYPGHALFTIRRGYETLEHTMGYLCRGEMPPLKAYS